MGRWEVRTEDRVVVAEGANWLLAVGSSAQALGLDSSSLRRLVCEIQGEGFVRIRDPKTGLRLSVRRVEAKAAKKATGLAAPMRAPTPRLAPDDDPSGAVDQDDTETTLDDLLPGMAPPQFTMPVPKIPVNDALVVAQLAPAEELAQPTVPEDLAERLFDLGMDIASAPDIETAALLAVDILNQFVPSESAAVLLVDTSKNALTFVAATGPHAEQAKTLLVPEGVGIAGYATATGRSLIVQDAGRDPRHFAQADELTGYETRSMLAAALVDADGQILGCLELINPPDRFLDWHLDAACSIASALAEAVSIRRPSPPAD